jgi:MBG domain (YGX type)/YDG domain/Immunoglobulin I-set domain
MRTRLRSKATLLFLTLAVLIAVPAVAFAADQIIADGDTVTAGDQASRNLGTVAPGATVTPNVNFSLDCKGEHHLYFINASDANEDTLSYNLTKASGTANVSITPIPGPPGAPGNFDVEFLTAGSVVLRASAIDGTATVTQDKTVTVASACTAPSVTTQPQDKTITYGENATFTAAANGTAPVGVQWQKSTDNGATWNPISGASSTNLTLTKPPVSDSGSKYRAVFTNSCGSATSNAATLTVNAKQITITPDSGQSKVYGQADPTLTYNADPALESGDNFTGALGRAPGVNVGNYAINLGDLSAGPNYDLQLSSPTVNFAITPKAITITPNSGQSKVYGSTDPTLTYTDSSPLQSGDSYTGKLGRASGESVGNYAINLGDLSAGPNYNLSLSATTVNFEITKKGLTISGFSAQNKVYDGNTNATITGTPSLVGVVGTDDVSLTGTASGTFASKELLTT